MLSALIRRLREDVDDGVRALVAELLRRALDDEPADDDPVRLCAFLFRFCCASLADVCG
jgi:hypothetical protein